MPELTPPLDPVALESEILAAAPHPGGSAAGERWGMLAKLLAAADLLSGAAVGIVVGVALALDGGRGLVFAAGAGIAWMSVAFLCGLSARQELRTWASGVPDAARLFTTALVMSWAFVALAAIAGAEHVLVAAVGGPLTAVVASGARAVARAFVHRLAPLRQRTLIIGSGRVACEVAAALSRHGEVGLQPIGIVDDEVHDVGGAPLQRLGGMGDLPSVLRDHAVDRVIIAFSRASHDDLLQCIRVCRDAGVAIDIVPRLFEFLDGAQALDQIGGMPLLSIGVPQLGRIARGAKRTLDVAVAGFGLLCVSPLILAIAVAIRVTSKGPVFFSQPRIGRGGEPFDVLKFRSMRADAEERKAELVAANEHADGLMFKIDRDPRITPVGRLLRTTSLDELPQLINVLRGEMSLVGPRPLIPQEHAHVAENWESRRLDLRPGITGLWQVSGRSDVSFRDMVRLDYQYVAGWSVARDLEILLATLPAVAGGRGAY